MDAGGGKARRGYVFVGVEAYIPLEVKGAEIRIAFDVHRGTSVSVKKEHAAAAGKAEEFIPLEAGAAASFGDGYVPLGEDEDDEKGEADGDDEEDSTLIRCCDRHGYAFNKGSVFLEEEETEDVISGGDRLESGNEEDFIPLESRAAASFGDDYIPLGEENEEEDDSGDEGREMADDVIPYWGKRERESY